MQNMTISQKKIIIITSVCMLTLLIFVVFVYLPTYARLNRLKAQLGEIEAQMREVEVITKDGKNIHGGIKVLKDRYNILEGCFPSAEDETLKKLVGFAKDMKIDVDSVEPRQRVVLVDGNNTPQRIEGKTCYKMPVSIKMRCSYKDLVNYAEVLRKSLAAFTTIEKLQIEKNQEDLKKLNIHAEINLYLLD